MSEGRWTVTKGAQAQHRDEAAGGGFMAKFVCSGDTALCPNV